MTRLPSGGVEQTKPPTARQLLMLERSTGLNCTKLNCTRRQASVWIEKLTYGKSVIVESQMMKQGAR